MQRTMDWITKTIAIGNFVDALDTQVLRQFRSILSLIPLLSDVKAGQARALPYLRDAFEGLDDDQFETKLKAVRAELQGKRVEIFELIDGPGNDLADFCKAIDTLGELACKASPVLVHCHAGRSRSPVVVAGHLMMTQR